MLDFLIRLLPWILLAGAVTILALIAKKMLDVRSTLQDIRRILETERAGSTTAQGH